MTAPVSVVEWLRLEQPCLVLGNVVLSLFAGRSMEYYRAWRLEVGLGYGDEINTTRGGEIIRYRLRFGLLLLGSGFLDNPPWQWTASQHHYKPCLKGTGLRLVWIWDNRGPEMQRHHAQGWKGEKCTI